MDSIVQKLSEIESAAAAIVENAETQKAQLENEMQQKRETFDIELENKTQEKIQCIRKELESVTSQLLTEQTGSNDSSILALREEYETRHELYAEEILARMTEV